MPQQPAAEQRPVEPGQRVELMGTVGRVRSVLPIIARRHKVMLLVALAVMVASGALNTVVPVLLGELVNRVAEAFTESPGGDEVFPAAAPFLVLIGVGYLAG
jgi:hypothetical protein